MGRGEQLQLQVNRGKANENRASALAPAPSRRERKTAGETRETTRRHGDASCCEDEKRRALRPLAGPH